MKRLAILGSTGSIGANVLDVVRRFPGAFEVVGLTAGRNVQLLKEQVQEFKPKVVSLLNEGLSAELRKELSAMRIDVLHGTEGLVRVATHPEVDMVVSALVGAAGLIPTLSAIKAGKSIALANKEALVMAGKLIMEEARERNVDVLPIDSEHSGIFQTLLGHRKEDISRIILTASGGPFLRVPLDELDKVTATEALKHPNWEMGRKVTVDSATLMNKGLEVIEAHWLFDIPVDKIDVQIHPQSIVHSMVEYIDGSVLAQMSIADMRIPISFALSYPKRLALGLPRLELSRKGELTFFQPDPERFPCLRLAYRSIEIGETMPAALNAANEVAVSAFLDGTLKFTDVPRLIERVMEAHEVTQVRTIADVLRADQWAREKARNLLEQGERLC